MPQPDRRLFDASKRGFDAVAAALGLVVTAPIQAVVAAAVLVNYLDRFTPEQARRHEVRPGTTGLAQVNGRNALTWEEKFALDCEYVDRRSVALDTQILWKTLTAVFTRKGINAEGHATMAEFQGLL